MALLNYMFRYGFDHIELVFKSCMLQTLHNSMTSFYYMYRLCLNLPSFAVIFIVHVVQLWNHKFNNYRTQAYLMFLTRPFFLLGIWYNMVWYDGMVCKYGLKTHTIPNTIPSYHTKIIINPYLELIKPLNQKRSSQEMKGQPYLSVRH